MAERTNTLNVNTGIQSFPSISISMGRARAFQGIAATMSKISGEMSNQADREAVVQATKKGTVAGATGTPELTGEATLAGTAYDDAARQSFANQVDIAARQKLADLEVEHAVDPAGFQKAAVGYMGGMATEINQVDPALGAVFSQTFQLRQATSSARIRSAYSSKIEGQLKGQVVTLANSLEKEVQGFAGDMLSGDVERSTLAFKNFAVSRERLNQAYMQKAPNGLSIYTGEQREKALIRFDDEFHDAAGREYVNQSPDKIAALRQITKTGGAIKIKAIDEDGKETVKTIKLMDGMTSDARERLVNHATQAANAQSRAILAERRNEEADIKRTEKIVQKDLIGLAYNNQLTEAVVMESKGDLTPNAFENLLKIAKTGGSTVDTKEGVAGAQGIITAFRDDGDARKAELALLDLAGSNQITITTLAGKMAEITSRVDRDGPKSLFHQQTDTFDDLIRTAGQLNLPPSAAFNLPIAKNEFIDWFQTFPARTDPETGEPFNRKPTREEAEAISFQLLSQAVPKSRGRMIEGSLLGVRVPKRAVTGSIMFKNARGQTRSKSMPGLVRGDDGNIDEEATANNYFKAFPEADPVDSSSYPDDLKRLFKELDDYANALENHGNLVDRIYGGS